MISVAPGAAVGRQNHQDGQCLGSLDRIVHLASGSPNQMKGGDAGSQLIRLRFNWAEVTVCLFSTASIKHLMLQKDGQSQNPCSFSMATIPLKKHHSRIVWFTSHAEVIFLG